MTTPKQAILSNLVEIHSSIKNGIDRASIDKERNIEPIFQKHTVEKFTEGELTTTIEVTTEDMKHIKIEVTDYS